MAEWGFQDSRPERSELAGVLAERPDGTHGRHQLPILGGPGGAGGPALDIGGGVWIGALLAMG
jgi:hypothetical protein